MIATIEAYARSYVRENIDDFPSFSEADIDAIDIDDIRDGLVPLTVNSTWAFHVVGIHNSGHAWLKYSSILAAFGDKRSEFGDFYFDTMPFDIWGCIGEEISWELELPREDAELTPHKAWNFVRDAGSDRHLEGLQILDFRNFHPADPAGYFDVFGAQYERVPNDPGQNFLTSDLMLESEAEGINDGAWTLAGEPRGDIGSLDILY